MCRLLNAFVMTWIEPTPRFPSLGIISTLVAPVEGRLQITLIVIWTFSNQDTTSLALLFQSRIRLSLLVAVGVLQSSLLQGFLPQLMLPVLHVQIRHLSEDLACHPSQALPLKIVVVLVTPPAISLITVAFQKSVIATDSLLVPTVATVGDAVQGSPLLLSDWESPQGVPPLQCEWDSLQGGPLLQREWDSPQGCPPLHSEWDSLQGGPLLQNEWNSPQGGPLSTANGIRFKGVPLSKTNGIRLKSVPLSTANGIRFKGVPFP